MPTVLCPKSATNLWINAVGLGAFLIAFPLLGFTGLDPMHQAVIAMVAAAGPIMVLDLSISRVHQRESAGLAWKGRHPINWARVGVKLTGLWATLAVVGLCYWAFKEYQGSLYKPFWHLLAAYGPWALAIAIPYFFVVDARMRDPHDTYWHFGLLVLGRFDEISWTAVIEHFRGWIIKGFFLPLMFSYLAGQTSEFHANLDRLLGSLTFLNFFDASLSMVFGIDLVFATAGYILMLRVLDAHLRWTEPTVLGWVVAIACYEPFWNAISSGYLMYHGSVIWDTWLEPYPILRIVWGSTIILLLVVYSWASVGFGCRFSNLTHRGILTSGAYRWTKHPAYISKNISWWLISIPWIDPTSPMTALKHCVLLLGVNVIYFMRAKTEERNLGHDPVYVAYCEYIDRHGLFWRVARLFARGDAGISASSDVDTGRG